MRRARHSARQRLPHTALQISSHSTACGVRHESVLLYLLCRMARYRFIRIPRYAAFSVGSLRFSLLHCCGRVGIRQPHAARDSLNGAPSRKRQQEWPSNCVIMLQQCCWLLCGARSLQTEQRRMATTEMFKLAIGCRPGFFSK